MGATYGIVFLWGIITCCVIKYFIQVELGRYCIINNYTTIQAFNDVPGPKWRGTSWLTFVVFIGILLTMPALMGILGSVAGLFYAIFPAINLKWWALITFFSMVLVLYRGIYGDIEKFVTFLVAGFSFSVFISSILVQGTRYALSDAEMLEGLKFKIPEGAGGIAISLMGSLGITAIEMFMYPYWILEKGYGRYVGARDPADLAGWLNRCRGWVNVMRVDALVFTAIATFITIGYYFMGSSVLHKLGVDVTGMDVVKRLSNMFTESYGAGAYWLFMFGAFCTLYSTLVVAAAAMGRMSVDFTASLGFVSRDEPKTWLKVSRWYQNSFAFLWLLFALSALNPVKLILFGAAMNGMNLTFFALAILILARKVESSLKMNRFSSLMLSFTSLIAVIYLFYSVYDTVQRLGK